MPGITSYTYPQQYLYRRIVQAKLFMDLHFAENIDLDCIAGEASFSKFHFIRSFKKIYGNTPGQYLIHVRIDHAKRLLEKNISVADACMAVGFDSVSTFTGLFKKRTGITPAHFQEKRMQLSKDMQDRPLHYIPHCFARTF